MSRHDRVSDLFVRALDVPAEEREAWVDAECGDDPAVRDEVLDLLARDAGAALVDDPVVDTDWDRELLEEAGALDDERPESIGGYRIVGLLGEGGMGRVYLARQENPDREVALKVLRPGVASKQVVRRFEAEARLLGRLRHPGIAQIHEAGVERTARGARPYFALERIEGPPITEHVRRHALGPREALELVARVADAVHHAHQRGVIHRDLKPANVLVDAEGRPKVLDFGVARLEDDDRSTTLLTQVGQIVGTLPYMSPEQLRGDPDAVDVRCDVYALGVLAYELLAGHLPHDVVGKPITEAARTILEEPVPPLARAVKGLSGDVQVIVERALAKEKERRYPSAAAFADDVRRHLRHEPIAARGDGSLYLLRTFARRHRSLVAGAAAALLSLAVGLVWALAERARALEARDVADDERRAAVAARDASDAVTRFLAGLFSAVDANDLGREVLVTDVLGRASSRLETDVGRHPTVEWQLQHTLGAAYLALGRPKEAAPHFARAWALRADREERDPREVRSLGRDHVKALIGSGRLEEARDVCGAILAESERDLGFEHPATLELALLHGLVLSESALRNEGDRLVRRVLDVHERSDPSPLDETGVISLHRAMSDVERRAGDFDAALAHLEEAIGIATAVHGPAHTITVGLEASFAGRLVEAGRIDEGVERLDRLRALVTDRHGPAHPRTRQVVEALFDAHARRRDWAKVEELRLASLDHVVAAYGTDSADANDSRRGLAVLYLTLGRIEDGLRFAREEASSRDRIGGPDDEATLAARSLLATLLMMTRDGAAEAEEICRDALERCLGRDLLVERDLRSTLASALRRRGEDAEAARVYEEEIARIEREDGPDDRALIGLRQSLAITRFQTGEIDEGIRLMERAVEQSLARDGAEHPTTLRLEQTFGSALASVGRFSDALPHLRRAVRGLERAVGADSVHTRHARADLEQLEKILAAEAAKTGG
ncbi:MAG: tetratricopeptide repeat protein [Planctomycetota bacterium JB042]